MRRGDVNYERWNPEAKALMVSCVSWFTLHGCLVDFNKAFVWSWGVHWLINAVWGLSYMWRVGSYGHRRLMAWRRYYRERSRHQ